MANGDINVRIAAVGDISQGRNEINPRFQANALRNARGLDCGVLANDFYNESTDYLGISRGANSAGEPFKVVSSSASSITIGAGMATAYGYDLQTEQNIALTTDENGSALSAATGYLFVYLEWDLTGSPAVGDIKIHNNGTAGVWRSIYTDNDNLIENPNGKYKLPLHRFYKSSTGSIRYDGSWETLNLARTIERPQVAEVALYAETMEAGDDTDRVATTKYCDDALDKKAQEIQSDVNTTMNALVSSINDTVLNFSETTLTVADVATLTLKRLAGIVTGYLDWEATSANQISPSIWSTGATVCTLPEGFRPQEDIHTTFFSRSAWNRDTYNSSVAWKCVINTDGTVVVEDMLSSTSSYSNYLGAMVWGFGFSASNKPTATYTDITDFTNYPINLSYDATKVYASAPSYFESGKSFKIRAIALTPAQEVTVSVSGGSVSGGANNDGASGNGTFTITPTSSATSMTIKLTAGVDEVIEHFIYIQYIADFGDDVYGLTEIYFSFSNNDDTRYTTITEVANALLDLGYDENSQITATGSFKRTSWSGNYTMQYVSPSSDNNGEINWVVGNYNGTESGFSSEMADRTYDSLLSSQYQHAMGDVASAGEYPAAPVGLHSADCSVEERYTDEGGMIIGTWHIDVWTADGTAYTELEHMIAAIYSMYGDTQFTVTGSWMDSGGIFGSGGDITVISAVSATTVRLYLTGYSGGDHLDLVVANYNPNITDTVTAK